jgi:hypothetical protein
MRKLGFADLLSRKDCRERDLCIALIAARILHPGSKLSLSQMLCGDSTVSTLALELGLGTVTDNELYEAMDWLLDEQEAIEAPCQKASAGGLVGPLRPVQLLPGRRMLSVGQARLQPGWQEGPPTDRVRAFVRP